MGEYGRTVGQSTGTAGGGGGSFDVGRELTGVLSDLADRIAALPPEVLLVIGLVVLGGLVMTLRTA